MSEVINSKERNKTMTNDEFDNKLKALDEQRLQNLSKLGKFAKALQTKVDMLWERRKNAIEQIMQLFSREGREDELVFKDGGIEAKIVLCCGDLRDKRDRSKISISIDNHNDRTGKHGETDRNNQETMNVGDLTDIEQANKITEEVQKLDDFVMCAERAIDLYFARASWIEEEQRKKLDKIIDPDDDDDGYW